MCYAGCERGVLWSAYTSIHQSRGPPSRASDLPAECTAGHPCTAPEKHTLNHGWPLPLDTSAWSPQHQGMTDLCSLQPRLSRCSEKGETEFVEIESKAFEEIQHAEPELAKRLLSGERLSYPTIVIWKGSKGKFYTESRDVPTDEHEVVGGLDHCNHRYGCPCHNVGWCCGFLQGELLQYREGWHEVFGPHQPVGHGQPAEVHERWL